MAQNDPDKFVPRSPEEIAEFQKQFDSAVESLGEDSSAMREMTVSCHTMYEEFMVAGFSDSQALYAAVSVICGGPKCP